MCLYFQRQRIAEIECYFNEFSPMRRHLFYPDNWVIGHPWMTRACRSPPPPPLFLDTCKAPLMEQL